jgi:tetratricopeptide (TPR) repeat protein
MAQRLCGRRSLLSFASGLFLVPTLLCSTARTMPPDQAASSMDLAAQADQSYQAKNWAEAAELYGAITKAHPDNARAWYRLGASLHGLGKQDEAIAAYQKCAQSVGGATGAAEYGIGVAYASKRDSENAFKYLQKSTEDGFNDAARLNSDEELSALRADARFAKVVEQANHNLKPCAYNPVNRQFDFWVGEWQVVTADGASPAGDSKIELILGDCVIQENWTSGGNTGYEGKSYNIYNPDLHRWEQFWNDNAGGTIHFYGNLKDGVMDYYTDDIPQKDGTKLKRHLQFIPLAPDKVRQFSRGSTDNGKTWNVEYDFIYNRKK